jgi:hypothetical protein
MSSYNQTQIKSIIETQWLTLDDNDGNLTNGTPNFTSIDGGFRAQGFPGYPDTVISNVVPIADSTNILGPYALSAQIVAQLSPPVTNALIHYRVNGGSFFTTSMTNTVGNTFTGSVPGQAALSHVEYYITAASSTGATDTYPEAAPGAPLDFDVGIKHVLRSNNFEAATDEGWTHGFSSGTAATDEWQRGIPAGKSGTGWVDPSAAASPNNCWGQDLGNGTSGSYSASSNTWLRTPITDCTGAVGTHLRFSRWLSVQGSGSDQARIKVNGTQIYINPTTSLNDAAWLAQDIDISAFADNNPSVQIEWSLQANATTNRGGWNIDDVRMVWVEAPPVCPAPLNYCIGAPNSVGPGAVMNALGTEYVSLNNFELECTGCPPFTSGLFFYGPNPLQAAFGNGFRCVGGSIHRFSPQQTDFFGDVHHPLDLNALPQPILAGDTWRFQFWYRNPAAGGAGFNLSDGLEVTFCP